MIQNKTYVICCLIYLLSLPSNFTWANEADSTASVVAISPMQELQNDIQSVVHSPDFSNAHIGISVLSIGTGEFFYKHNENKNFIPASVLKLISTAAALEYLGKDFQYKTSLFLDGNLKENGEFQGNILIRGSGDPTFSDTYNTNPVEVLNLWAIALDSIGIRSIRGNIIADANYFDHTYYPSGWSWDDMSLPFSAQVSALSINDNKISISLTQGDSVGYLSKVDLKPHTSYVRVLNNINTGNCNDPVSYQANKDLGSNMIELYGTLPYDSLKVEEYTSSVSIDDPPLFFLNLFKGALKKNNIRFRGALLDINNWNEKIDYTNLLKVATHTSPPLSKIIPIINQQSHNLGSELILKTIAKEVYDIGSFDKGIEAINKFIAKHGVPPEKISIVDGSGLSRFNFISPAYFVNFLATMYRSKHADIFLNSLALPGKEGTLKSRMTMSRAEENVKAKTGSMNNVSNICGYVQTRDGEVLAFAIMLNNFTVPQSLAQNFQDMILMRLASFTRK